MLHSLSRHRLAGLLGIAAAAAAAFADWALQYTGNAAHLGSKEYLYLLDVPPSRLLIGHFVPLALVIVLAGIMRLMPTLRPILLPCGINLANLIFFALATARLWNRTVDSGLPRTKLDRLTAKPEALRQ